MIFTWIIFGLFYIVEYSCIDTWHEYDSSTQIVNPMGAEGFIEFAWFWFKVLS